MTSQRVVAIVLAGGEGRRLRPLTADCAKPALPFAGGFRIIDFVLSNLWNSSVRSIFVALQYKSEVLRTHLRENWNVGSVHGSEFIEAALPENNGSGRGFRGTADCVYQCLDLLDGYRPDAVAVFAADHVYRMDVRQMLAFHHARRADATVAAIPVAIEHANRFGVITARTSGQIETFTEKPRDPQPMPGRPESVYASMGNYLFRPQVLRAALIDAKQRGGSDFGLDVLPVLARTHRIFAYDFSTNRVPGLREGETPAYWRDVGDPASYADAHWDLLGPAPRIRLDNAVWPMRCGHAAHAAAPLDAGDISNTILGPGARAQGAFVRDSVLQRGARIAPGAQLERCIVMDGVSVECGVAIKGAILGRAGRVDHAERIA